MFVLSGLGMASGWHFFGPPGRTLEARDIELVWTDYENGVPVRIVETNGKNSGSTPYTAHFEKKTTHGYLISAQLYEFVDAIDSELPALVAEQKQKDHFATLVITQGEKKWTLFLNRGNPHAERLRQEVGENLPDLETPGQTADPHPPTHGQ